MDYGCKCIALEVNPLFLSFLWQSYNYPFFSKKYSCVRHNLRNRKIPRSCMLICWILKYSVFCSYATYTSKIAHNLKLKTSAIWHLWVIWFYYRWLLASIFPATLNFLRGAFLHECSPRMDTFRLPSVSCTWWLFDHFFPGSFPTCTGIILTDSEVSFLRDRISPLLSSTTILILRLLALVSSFLLILQRRNRCRYYHRWFPQQFWCYA